MSDVSNNGGPWWSRLLLNYGLSSLLVLYLLGMLPGLKSPIDRILDRIESHDINVVAVAEQTASLRVDTNRELLRVLRTICRYQVPTGRQWECDPSGHGGSR